MEGEETQVDKVLVERLLDPLLHLVRNALAHGLESPEEREQAGKEPVGTLRLRALPQGVLCVASAGRGALCCCARAFAKPRLTRADA